MPTYQSTLPFEHGSKEALGVLLVNLGTPDAATPAAVRRYLAEFLWDPRVIEQPRALWWLILHGVILRIRPARSAHAYRKIWTDAGSPLLVHSTGIASGLQERLSGALASRVIVKLGMSYGQPSIDQAIGELLSEGARHLVVLPLYPQYSGTTTGSVFDAVTSMLGKRRWVPELSFINHYHDEPDYIAALARSIREHWDAHARGELLLFSFHGVPRQTLLDGDPYHCQCQKTGRLVAEALGLDEHEWRISFQSRVGRQEWLRPYTDETVAELGRHNTRAVDVVCPGFSADCLETLEEIAMQNNAIFQTAGGGQLHYIPALNARDDHVAFLTKLVTRHAGGWIESAAGGGSTDAEREQSNQRALKMGAAT